MRKTEFTQQNRLSGADIVKILNINYGQLKANLLGLPNHSPYFDLYNKTLYEQMKYIVQNLSIDNLLNQLELISITIIMFEKQMISEKQLIDFLGPEFDQHLKSLGRKFSDQMMVFKSSIICSYSEASGNLDIDLFKIIISNVRNVQSVLDTVSLNMYGLFSQVKKFFDSPPAADNQSDNNASLTQVTNASQ